MVDVVAQDSYDPKQLSGTVLRWRSGIPADERRHDGNFRG